MANAVLAFALEQLAERWESEGDRVYQQSRRIRDAQEKDPQTEEMVNVDADTMYELGHAEAWSSAYRAAASQVRKLMKLLEAE